MKIEIEAGPDPLKNGGMARAAIARDGAEVVLGPGIFDFGTLGTTFGQDVWLHCAGKGKTIMLCSQLGHDCAWEANLGVIIENLTMKVLYGPGMQNQVFGFQRHNAPPDAKVIIRAVEMIGGSFSLYTWTALRAHFMVYDSPLSAGGWPVCAGMSDGSDSQLIELFNCPIIANRLLYPGADANQMAQTAGLVARGGRIRMDGGSIETTGAPGVAAYGALCTASPLDPKIWPSPEWPRIEISDDVKITVNPNGSEKFAETYAQVGKIFRAQLAQVPTSTPAIAT
jgi:hypothetical protein